MPRTGVSKTDIIRAVEEIISKGDNPTVVRISEFLGNTGSHSTISKYLSELKFAEKNDVETGSRLSLITHLLKKFEDQQEKYLHELNDKINALVKATQEKSQLLGQLQELEKQNVYLTEQYHRLYKEKQEIYYQLAQFEAQVRK